MGKSPYVFEDSVQVKPVRVRFGGLDAVAFEIIVSGGMGGTYIKTLGDNSSAPGGFCGTFDIQKVQRIGTLQCDTCAAGYRFHAGRVFTFPFIPLPGWVVWNPPALRDPHTDTSTERELQEIEVRVRCDKCAGKLESYISGVFDSGYVR